MIDALDFAPFSLYIQAVDSTEHTVGPRYVRVVIDLAFMDKLERRNAFCAAENLTECLENLSPRDWDRTHGLAKGQPASAQVEQWKLMVDTDEFCFFGRQDGENITESRLVSTAGLSRWLHGAPDDAQTADEIERDGESCFRLVGNVLVHAEEEMPEFVEMLRLSCPEFAASVLEAEMAKRIATPQEATGIAAAQRRMRHV